MCRPRFRRRRRGDDLAVPTGRQHDLDRPSLGVLFDVARDEVAPQHREVRLHHLVGDGQVQPDLEQLQRIGGLAVDQREHLRVQDALARRQPLDVAAAITRGRAHRVGVIEESAPHDGHGFEPAMGMLRETRDDVAVVHAPSVLALEVLADVAPGQRCGGAHGLVAGRITVVVVNAEQERIAGLPGERERRQRQDRVRALGVLLLALLVHDLRALFRPCLQAARPVVAAPAAATALRASLRVTFGMMASKPTRVSSRIRAVLAASEHWSGVLKPLCFSPWP